MSVDSIRSAAGIAPRPQPIALTGGETSSSAAAHQAKAMVESRYMMALHRPRDWDVVRQKVVTECRRPMFANNPSAYYRKPIGKGVEGLGIRFVEAALRCMTNVLTETVTVYEDAEKRILRVVVTDLEANDVFSKDVTVTKTVERSKPAEDGSYLSVRKNSFGKDVFTIVAGDDDLLNKEGALVSKAIRTLGLRIIPGDIQDEAEAIILKTRTDEAARDPAETRKKIVDAFSGIGITAMQLIEYLGHSIDQTAPDELVELRGLYGSLRDGETTWRSVMENKREKPSEKPGAGAKPKDGAAPADTQAKQEQQATAQPATEQSSQPETRAQPSAADDEFGDMNTGD